MTIYKFEREFEFSTETKNREINPDFLGRILEIAEEKAYQKLYASVSRHFIDFGVDSDVKLLQENERLKLSIVLTINLEISPITPKVVEQDKIAEEIASAFFESIRKRISKILGKNDQ